MNEGDVTRVRALQAVGRWQEALDRLAGLRPGPGEAWELLALQAQCQLALDRPRAALAAAEQARAAAPQQEWTHRLVAVALTALGRPRPALAAAREAARLAPFGAEALSVLAGAQLDSRQVAEAQGTADLALQLWPASAQAHRDVAAVASAVRDWPRAETHLRQALALAPQHAPSQLALAEVLEVVGRSEDAVLLRVGAVRSDPQSAMSRRSLASGRGVAAGGSLLFLALGGLQVVRAVALLPRFGAAVGLTGLVALFWAVTAVRRRRAGRALPPGFYPGLRDERLREDLGYVLVAGLLVLLLGVVDGVRAAAGGGGAALAAVELSAGAGVAAAARARRRRLSPPEDDDRTAWDGVRVVVRRARSGGGRDRAVWRDREVVVVGRPRLVQRLLYGVVVAWASSVLLLLGAAGGPVVLSVVAVVVLLVPPLRLEGTPVATAGGTALRLVVRKGTAGVLPPATRVVRHLLRLLLAPLVAGEHLLFGRRPHRCLHDLLTGAEVVLVSSATPRPPGGDARV